MDSGVDAHQVQADRRPTASAAAADDEDANDGAATHIHTTHIPHMSTAPDFS